MSLSHVVCFSASKNEYFRIFKKLYNHFVTELNEQSDDMYCKHLAELMHVISVEKMLAFTMRDALKSGEEIEHYR